MKLRILGLLIMSTLVASHLVYHFQHRDPGALALLMRFLLAIGLLVVARLVRQERLAARAPTLGD